LHAPLYNYVNNHSPSSLSLLYDAQGITCFADIVTYPV